MEEQLRRDALEYHRVPTPGKISVTPTKSLVNQRDLALAYSPGVAYACLAIEMGCEPADIGKTIHPHPTLCESIGMAAEVFEGVCTDLPPAKTR